MVLAPAWVKPKNLSLLTLAAWLIGCQSWPERNLESSAPQPAPTWTTATQSTPVSERWLALFADPNLSALVEEALSTNFDLQAAAARVLAARAQAGIAGADRWPQLSLQPGYQRSRTDGGGEAEESSAFSALFDLSWELDLWGRIAALREAATYEANASEADFLAARLSLAAGVAQSYFRLTEAKLQADVAEQSIRDRRTLADLVRGRFNRGLTHGLDLRLVLTDLATAEAQLAEARNRIQTESRLLELLLGRYPSGRQFAAANLPAVPTTISAGIPAQLLERRPDLIAAFQRLRASDSRLESAQKNWLPRITLTAGGGTSSPALTQLIDPQAVVWNIALGLTQPLFTGGRIQGEIDLQEAQAQEALNLFKHTALNAFREVEQTLAAEEWLKTQELALREAVAQTEASQALAVYSYRQGLIEILTLLDSYRSTLNAQSAHLTVKRQLLSNRIDLYLALGGSV